MVLLIALAAAATCGLVAFAIASSRSDLVRRVAALERGSLRAAPHPLLRFAGTGDQVKLRERLSEAGWYRVSPTAFHAASVGALALGAGSAAGLFALLGRFDALVLIGALCTGMVASLVPRAALDRAVAARKLAIARSLPNWLDIVSTSVEAGTALTGAIAASVEAIHGPLAEELREVMADVRLGRSRSDALTAMAQRVKQVDLSSTVTAMVQTERLGGNIGHVLDELAAEARNRRLMRAEEIAAALPVKMVIPMALFMLPALLVTIFGPVAAQLVSQMPK